MMPIADPPIQTSLTRVSDAPLAAPSRFSEVGALIHAAIEHGQNPTELYALLKEERATQARMAYNKALRNLQEECPSVAKTRKIVSEKGGVRMYASLDDIMAVARPIMAKHGLSVTWSTEPRGQGLSVVCRLKHEDGHEGSGEFPYVADTSKFMSTIQNNGSGQKYAMRYSFLAVSGIMTCDEDNDGEDERETITVEQSRTLNDLVVESGSVLSDFLAVYSIDELGKLPAFQFDAACELLNKRIQHRRAKA